MASTYESPTGWYSELDPGERRTFWACFGGWMLDAMDVQIFSFAIPAIIAAFTITNADAGLIGTVTLLTSAFGGWFAGALSDRFGRVRTLQITIVWFAFFTFLCGFAQSYTQLFIFRALMGLGFGGECAEGAVLMGEVIRAQHRGKAVGSVQSGWAIGWGIAAIMATWFFSVLPQDTAWRALFWVGILPAFLVVFVGSFVGYLVGAYLADRIGRRANFILFAVCSVLTVFVYTQLPVNDTMMLILGFPLGFFASGIFSGMGAFLTENFPTRVRGSGQGFAYNFGRGVAALNPFFVGVLSATLPLGQSIGVFAVIAYGILIVAALLLPETKGRELTADA